MEKSADVDGVGMRMSSGMFLSIEHGIYIALGALLSITAITALGTAGYALFAAILQGGGGSALLTIVDQLLFVLMLAEILHTVRVSIRSGTLTSEPFLVVGLIASIRRVLVITLQSSHAAPGKTSEPGHEELFNAAMIELGVLAGLILIMVVSIYLIRRSGIQSGPQAGGMD